MRVCVVGCGAVGSLFAANLAQLDDVEVWAYDVSQAHVDAINRDGLRLDADIVRYHQIGTGSGWVEVDGARHELTDADCVSTRDHSWGVRPTVGGFEPFTGTRTPGGVASSAQTGDRGLFLIYFGFASGRQGGDVQIKEDGSGKRFYLDGEVYELENLQQPLRVVDAGYYDEHFFIYGTLPCNGFSDT